MRHLSARARPDDTGVTADTTNRGWHIVPRKALDLGYQFRFPALEQALRDLVRREGDERGGTTG
jgi:hypothetical protein